MTKGTVLTTAAFFSAGLGVMLSAACGSNKGANGFDTGDSSTGNGGSSGGSGSGSGGGSSSDDGGSAPVLQGGDASTAPPPTSTTDAGVTCVNLQCQQSTCGDGGSATLTGHIYDPAGNNPLYKVVAYIPNEDPSPITDGITSDSCSCSGLYSGTPIADGITDATGTFTLPNAPVGTNIPLVIQIGKWRNYFTIPQVQCGTNDLDTLLPAKLTLPKTQNETKFSNIPNIAVSTGNADSLECLFKRVGLADTEYSGDPNTTSAHIHIFAGTEVPAQFGGPPATPVPNTASPAGPTSTSSLWDSLTDLSRYDIVFLSCEGQPTGGANAASSSVMAQYVDQGGRIFASHYQYAFFNTATEFSNVATWDVGGSYPGAISGTIETTLASGAAFPEGQALYSWLGSTLNVLVNNELPIAVARKDATVTSGNLATAWVQDSDQSSTQYFSWDMPFNAPLDDAGSPNYCGRVVFSDLHVGANENDYNCLQTSTTQGNCVYGGTANPTPTACASGTLQPAEDAIEFILFDLSSCVTPVTAPPPPPVVPPPPVPPPK